MCVIVLDNGVCCVLYPVECTVEYTVECTVECMTEWAVECMCCRVHLCQMPLQNVKINMSLYMVTILAGMLFTHIHTPIHACTCTFSLAYYCCSCRMCTQNVNLIDRDIPMYIWCAYFCAATSCVIMHARSLQFPSLLQRGTFSHSLGHRGTNWVPLTSTFGAFLNAALMMIS